MKTPKYLFLENKKETDNQAWQVRVVKDSDTPGFLPVMPGIMIISQKDDFQVISYECQVILQFTTYLSLM